MTGTGQAQETFLPLLLSLISKLTVTLLNSFTHKFSNENESHRLSPKENAAMDRPTHTFMYLQEVHSLAWDSHTESNPVVFSFTLCLTCMCSSVLWGSWVMHEFPSPGMPALSQRLQGELGSHLFLGTCLDMPDFYSDCSLVCIPVSLMNDTYTWKLMEENWAWNLTDCSCSYLNTTVKFNILSL